MERRSGYKNLGSEGVPLKEIEQLIQSGMAPGCSISIITNSGELESSSFGYLDNKKSETVTPHTVYDLASISKLFTTAVILKLHEAGKLSIDDLCSKYLDNFSSSDISILDLLTHRVDFGIRLSEYRSKYPGKGKLTTALMGIEIPAAPSDSVHYANLGFIYLGTIIEKSEDKGLNETMKGLFHDLDLQETYTGSETRALGITTPPTEVVDGQVVQNITHDETSRLLGGIAGNAGVFSSAEDLARFGKAWTNGKIIKTAELVEKVFHNYDRTGLKPQALGWWMRIPTKQGETPTPEVYSHTGFTGSLLALNSQTGTVCAFTCNRTYYGRDNSNHKEVWKLLTDWMQG